MNANSEKSFNDLNCSDTNNPVNQRGNLLKISLMRYAQFIIDLFILAGVFIFSNLIRFDFHLPKNYFYVMIIQMFLVVAIQFFIYSCMGIYRFVWRYISLKEISYFLYAPIIAAVPITLLRLFVPIDYQAFRVPISIIIMDAVFVFTSVLGIRIIRRIVYEQKEFKSNGHDSSVSGKQRVLLIGAGRSGIMTAKEIQSKSDSSLSIVGFVDDDPEKAGLKICGVDVLGTTKQIPELVQKHKIDHVILAISNASRRQIGDIVSICEKICCKVRIVPGLSDLIEGKISVSKIRDVQIEDLLGRDVVQLELENIQAYLKNKCILVSGAGGSIGSEIVRQISRYEPRIILLAERSEFALYSIHSEMRERSQSRSEIIPLLADIGDRTRMEQIFKKYAPEVILHAAAHKHVPLMEFNAGEAIKNNVIGTRTLVDISCRFNAEVFVLISTDKAVNPTSVMGASKRLAEIVVQSYNQKADTRCLAVRFGNVLGSTGSVIPKFKRQIANNEAVTVTHPEMTRYFMTIPEAVQLVLQAGAIGEGGEIFILDMGEPVKILDLAERMIRLSGFQPYTDIDIVFTGIRPGEKLFEELNTRAENVSTTRHPKIFIGKIAQFAEKDVINALQQLETLAQNGNEVRLRRFISSFLAGEAQLAVPDSVAFTAS